MKKLLSVLLAVLLLATTIPLSAVSVSAATSGEFTYTISGGEVTITDCDTSVAGELEIPSHINGYPVTAIGYNAFGDCTGLTYVYINDGITTIGSSAFQNCTGLTRVYIPDSVTLIGNSAFYNCTSLKSVTIPGSVTTIKAYAFAYCSSLRLMSIPDGVTDIDTSTFAYCTSLEWVTIPDSVTFIGLYAFYGCIGLTDVYYGGREADKATISYASYNTPFFSATWHYNTIGGLCGDDAMWVYYVDQEKLVISGTGDVRGNWVYLDPRYVIIEEGITGVPYTDFAGVYGDVYVLSLPSTLTDIGQYSFQCGARTIIINGTKGLYAGTDRTACGYLFFQNTTVLRADTPFAPYDYNYDGIVTLNGKIYYSSTYTSYGMAYSKHYHTFKTFSNGDFTGLMCTSCKMPRDVSDFVCQHEWNDATCTKPATCAICGAKDGETLADHTYGESVETLAPTCITAGEKKSTCSVCGDVKIETIPATAIHNWKDGCCTVCGATTPTIWVSTSEAFTGDVIEVEVKLLNNPGIIGATVEILYDKDVMELLTWYDEDEEMDVNQIRVASGWSSKYITFGSLGRCKVSFMRGTATSNVTKEDFFTATFRIKDDAVSGTYPLTVVYNPKDFVNVDWDVVAFDTQDGYVEVSSCRHEYWDACDKYCQICGELTNPDATHSMLRVDAVAPSCFENGNIEYWYCEYCGQAWIDAECTQHIFLYAVVLPMAHGMITHVPAVAPTCYENGNIEYWYCADCGQAWLDAEFTLNTNLLAVKLPMAHGTIEHVDAKNATCTELGNIEFWYCADCGQAWLDAECTLNTNLMAVKLPSTGHTYDNNYDVNCNVCGQWREIVIICGDINGDGEVTIIDEALVSQYLAGWDVTLYKSAADINGDGEVTIIDEALMSQHLAGWDGPWGG